MKIPCISVKKSVVQIEHFFRKKRRYLLYFYAILMPIYQHHRNARMMRLTCVLHENTLYFMINSVVKIEHLKKTARFAVFQCNFDVNLPI